MKQLYQIILSFSQIKIKYNNNENKFVLNQYEIEIEKQIINGIIEDILIYLAKF